LQGAVKVPASKSLCHRAIIAAGLSDGKSIIDNVVFSDDISATCNGMMTLGANMLIKKHSVTLNGTRPLTSTKNTIHCNESGSTLRFLIPLAILTGSEITFIGKGLLGSRPLTPYYSIFKEQNISYSSSTGLPLTIKGTLKPGEYKLPGNISSQFITGLMLALPLLDGNSTIILTTELESKGYIDLTLSLLKKFSINIENSNYREFYISGNQSYKAINYTVEGDFSQAAFWLTAGILGREIQCVDMDINSLQGDKVIVDIIKEMGGDIHIKDNKLTTRMSKTKGITIDASNCPDLVPILSVLASVSSGTTKIVNAGRLRIKESNRLRAMAVELAKLGAAVSETSDGLIIHGKESLKGGTVHSWNDHRIAMALTIASIKCTEPLILENCDVIKKSYPEFYKDFIMLGGKAHEWSMG
jgi:3-phosphoshikimate 1-carboxyvinyltransferase